MTRSHRLAASTFAALALFGAALASGTPAHATPKKALGDYSKTCQDMHLQCLNDCQKNYASDADVRTCFGMCDGWLDQACDVVFPGRLMPFRSTAMTQGAAVLVTEHAAKSQHPGSALTVGKRTQ